MKTIATVFFSLVVAVCLSGLPAWAQHGGGHPGGPPGGAPRMGQGKETGPSTSKKPTGKEAGTEVLSRNTKLCDHLSSTLGTSCANLQTACSGFKNLGQCVAAWHVSKNLGGSCAFDSLKTAMVGGSSLGKAIQGCDPKANATAEARKAEKQAKRDIRESGS
jgi:hypothetical protein